MTSWLERYDEATREQERCLAIVQNSLCIRQNCLWALRHDGMSIRQIADLVDLPGNEVRRMIRDAKARANELERTSAEIQSGDDGQDDDPGSLPKTTTRP